MRRPNDPKYDPSTLYIPMEKWKEFTPGMIQYWDLKSVNFEKIVFFKLAKFYEVYYHDAIITQRVCDLNWVGHFKNLHVGFAMQGLDKYLHQMVNAGFKVAVVEQTETARQLVHRNKRDRGKYKGIELKKSKCQSRQVCSVVTKGTYKLKEQTYESKFILAFRRIGNSFGITFFDVTTLQIFCG